MDRSEVVGRPPRNSLGDEDGGQDGTHPVEVATEWDASAA